MAKCYIARQKGGSTCMYVPDGHPLTITLRMRINCIAIRHGSKATVVFDAVYYISSMWHEARKQEKKLREAMIDYQRRAERRREHYAKIVSRVF